MEHGSHDDMLPVLGIDPSLENLGLAAGWVSLDGDLIEVDLIVHNKEAKEPKPKKGRRKKMVNRDDFDRARGHGRILVKHLRGKALTFAELPVGSQSARAMASYGVSIGVLAGVNRPIIPVSPYDVKVAALNNKNACKEEMIEWAMDLYPHLPWAMFRGNYAMTNEHCADAIAAIHAGVKTDEFQKAIAMFKTMKEAA